MQHKETPARPEIKLIAGLGNPGTAYKNTYHNTGLIALEWLLKSRPDAGSFKDGGAFEYMRSQNMIWIKPSVFMNDSGRAVASAKNYFKIRNENILVLHDDSDIEIGKFKVAFDRSSAGHKGVESIISALHGSKFWRVRIGVRSRTNKKKALGFVLKKISPVNKIKLEEVFKKIPKLFGVDSDASVGAPTRSRRG